MTTQEFFIRAISKELPAGIQVLADKASVVAYGSKGAALCDFEGMTPFEILAELLHLLGIEMKKVEKVGNPDGPIQ